MALSSLWIKVSTQLPRHPKLIKAAEQLEICSEELIGRLCLLWIYCAEYRPSGYIATSEELASAMHWKGDPEFLARGLAMIPCFQGFLDYEENMTSGFYVHDWEIFNQSASNASEKRREMKKREEKPDNTRESKIMEKTDRNNRTMPPEVKEQLAKLFAHVRVN